MDSNTFERINLCQNTPCKDMDKCRTSLPSTNVDNTLVPLHLLIFFWSLPRGFLRYLALDMLLVALSIEANVHCYSDLDCTKLYSQWLGHSLTPVCHLSTTSSPNMGFGNSHNIPKFLIKYAKGCTPQY